jgi:hypothetical protein
MFVVSTVFGLLKERRLWRKGGWLKEKGKAHSRGNPMRGWWLFRASPGRDGRSVDLTLADFSRCGSIGRSSIVDMIDFSSGFRMSN